MGIDQELAHAIKRNEEESPAEVGAKPSAAPARAAKRRLGLLFGSLGLAGVILFFAFGPESAPPSIVGVGALLNDKGRYAGRLVRVRGTLVAGTLAQLGNPCHTQFALVNESPPLQVRYSECVLPDAFRDQQDRPPVEVMAEGVLKPGGYFEANHLLVRDYRGYEMQKRPLPSASPSPLERFKAE